MNFNKHSAFEGMHAFLGASKYHWINYDEESINLSTVRALILFRALQQGYRQIHIWQPRKQKLSHTHTNARPTIQKMKDKGIIQGDESGRLGLTMEMIRMFIVLDRVGVFDK